LLIDERSRRAVEVAELFADGKASAAELESAKTQAWSAYCEGVRRRREAGLESDRLEGNRALANHAAGWVANKNVREAARKTSAALGWVRFHTADPKHIWKTADLIRETFGNPFRPIVFHPAWLTPTVLSLAQAAYAERILPGGELDRD